MRIACIHIPQFALLCASRLDPALRGAPVVAAGGLAPGRDRPAPPHTPVVMAGSRAAWARGVRLGMTAAAARARSPELTIVTADPALERETVRAIADATLGLSETVDLGGRVGAGGAHRAMYCAGPVMTRGTTLGDRRLALRDELGLTGRSGIADDRFTAWVAASHAGPAPVAAPHAGAHAHAAAVAASHAGAHAHAAASHAGAHAAASHAGVSAAGGRADAGGVTSVPRGGSAAFLASRPLSLLAIPTEVQHMLEALGVRTLGEFAALPAPSVQRPVEADYQALARGESGTHLRAYVPEAPVREEILVGGNVLDRADAGSGPAAVARVARRLELRLAGRARHAAALEVAALPVTGWTGVLAPHSVEARSIESLARPANTNESTGSSPGNSAGGSTGGLRANSAGGSRGNSGTLFAASPTIGAPIDAQRELPVSLDAPTGDAADFARVLAAAVDAARTAEAGAWKLRVVVAAESVPGAETREVFAEGSAPVAAAGVARMSAGVAPAGTGVAAAADASAVAVAGSAHLDSGAAIHPRAAVLSTPGSRFALSPPDLRAERRDAHRRTRRGKQRRARPTALSQAKLFDRRS